MVGSRMTAEQALREAARRVGSRAALARALGVSPQAAQDWRVAPSRHALRIERLTVNRRDLRPDLYPRPAKAAGPQLAQYWAAREALINAVEALPPAALGLTRETQVQYLNEIALPWIEAPRRPVGA
jgi:DNA-binding transcriptional regulator YdaS (Cro superfamily)